MKIKVVNREGYEEVAYRHFETTEDFIEWVSLYFKSYDYIPEQLIIKGVENE